MSNRLMDAVTGSVRWKWQELGWQQVPHTCMLTVRGVRKRRASPIVAPSSHTVISHGTADAGQLFAEGVLREHRYLEC